MAFKSLQLIALLQILLHAFYYCWDTEVIKVGLEGMR